tara:strand:+ start:2337 stop:2681 length:345 start_codon:yes stop_codon:yes gene_type:complete
MMLPSFARLPLSLGTTGADSAPVQLVVGWQYVVHRKTSDGGKVYVTFECIALTDGSEEVPADRVKIVSVVKNATRTRYEEELPVGVQFYFFRNRFYRIDNGDFVFRDNVTFKMC